MERISRYCKQHRLESKCYYGCNVESLDLDTYIQGLNYIELYICKYHFYLAGIGIRYELIIAPEDFTLQYGIFYHLDNIDQAIVCYLRSKHARTVD